eukprot:GHRR01023636.1.p1 GENE.GHRR01023636.1~~GHRR01023636.1.p1  ORF type:complete len:124 (-),score=9.04 GHRR01023636.1:864-1235(-)
MTLTTIQKLRLQKLPRFSTIILLYAALTHESDKAMLAVFCELVCDAHAGSQIADLLDYLLYYTCKRTADGPFKGQHYFAQPDQRSSEYDWFAHSNLDRQIAGRPGDLDLHNGKQTYPECDCCM